MVSQHFKQFIELLFCDRHNATHLAFPHFILIFQVKHPLRGSRSPPQFTQPVSGSPQKQTKPQIPEAAHLTTDPIFSSKQMEIAIVFIIASLSKQIKYEPSVYQKTHHIFIIQEGLLKFTIIPTKATDENSAKAEIQNLHLKTSFF